MLLFQKATRTICVSRDVYKNYSGGYRLENLEPGNYSFQLLVYSEGGPGTKTKEFFFCVDCIASKRVVWTGAENGGVVQRRGAGKRGGGDEERRRVCVCWKQQKEEEVGAERKRLNKMDRESRWAEKQTE